MWSVAPVCGAKGIPAYIHPDDREMLADPAKGMSLMAKQQFLGGMTFSEPDDVKALSDGEVVTLAGLDFTIGHTPGSYAGLGHLPQRPRRDLDALFTGDLLFAGSIGRTDLPGGDHARSCSAWPARSPCPTRRSCCPATARRPRSATSARTNPFLTGLPACPEGAVTTMSFQAPKGVSEYVPPRSALFAEAREAFAESARRACYAEVETAVFEDTSLFVRGVGESSDVVRKEMYSFTDRGGREITLRPEFTAGVLRAVLEHNLHKGALPVKVFTSGPAFRYERPQPAGTGSSTSSTWRRSAPRTRRSTPRRSRSPTTPISPSASPSSRCC